MRTNLTFLLLFVASCIFAQLPQLRPEVVELYRLQALAQQSRRLNSDDLIATHKPFFNHPLFCEIVFGIEYIHLARHLLIQERHEYAEKYFLKATRSQYINVLNHLTHIFVMVKNQLEVLFNRPGDVIVDTVFLIPRTPENMRFKETMLEKILEIEKKQIRDPRILAIAQELGEMFEMEQAVRINVDDPEDIFWTRLDSVGRRRVVELQKRNLSMREVDSMNINRIIELIRENPDIAVLNIQIQGRPFLIRSLLWRSLRLNERFARTAWTDFFEPYFRERAENGRGLDYCRWYDVYRWHIRRDIPYYGVYNPFRVLFEDYELEIINERRERVGLLPLIQY